MKKIIEKPSMVSRKGFKIASWLFFTGILASSIACGKDNTVKNDSSEHASKAYIIQLSIDPAPVLPQNYDELSRFNFYGICWNGTVADNLKFARQMGYSYVMYQNGMENSSLAKDLFFYLESPDYQIYNTLGIDRELVINKASK